jgi:hypothetical protein
LKKVPLPPKLELERIKLEILRRGTLSDPKEIPPDQLKWVSLANILISASKKKNILIHTFKSTHYTLEFFKKFLYSIVFIIL